MSKVLEAAIKTPVLEAEASIMEASWDNTSKKIRGLSSLGYTTGEIEKLLIKFNVTTKEGKPIRYQHVRNILITKVG